MKKLSALIIRYILLYKTISLCAILNWRKSVTVHTPLSREVFWHKYAKIPRHTSQNAITEGDLREQRVKVRACTEP